MTNDDMARAVAEWSCAKLITRFAYSVDHRRYDDLLNLLAEDAVVEWPGNSVSPQELVAQMKQVPANLLWCHMLSPPVIDRSEADAIEMRSYVVLYDSELGEDDEIPAASAPSSVAEYHDSFRLTPQGWRMARRSVALVMGTPF